MNDQAKTSSASSGTGRRSSKIDIKLMCQRFEQLNHGENLKSISNVTSNSQEDQSSIICEAKPLDNLPILHRDKAPKPPLRKPKNRNSVTEKSKNFNNIRNVTDVSCNNNFEITSPKTNNANKLSVRERTKLFESKNNVNSNISCNITKSQINHDVLTSKSENCSSSEAPLKPPRTSVINDALSKEKILDGIQSMQKEYTPGRKSSLGSKNAETNGHSTDAKKFPSPPYASVDVTALKPNLKYESVKSTPKFTGFSSKTTAFVNYFKNLSSTATQLREKVKNKSANLFVDLTPTTVSPPKHYGTLKRSHSEEHIYAEPFEGIPEAKDKMMPADPLHYMCTPLFQTPCSKKNVSNKKSVTSTDNSEKEHKFKKFSVRDIIYESFALLRRPLQIEGAEINEKNEVEGDSESDVSVKDVQERIIYVKSVKKQISVSSICIAPKLFEALLLINISDEGPDVIFKYPKMLKKEFDYPLIPHLCFPDYQQLEAANIYKCEMFHFTLVAGGDEKIFGYCHRILGWPEQTQGFCYKFPLAICILSSISAPLFYKKILVEIEKHMVLPVKDCTEYLSSLRKLGVPNAGASVSIPDNTEEEPRRVVITRPLDSHVIGIDLTRTLQLLDVDLMLRAVSSLLLERRVLLLSRNSWNALQCCAAISSLLYPFQWQHLMIPIVPSCLLVQCCTESPYLLGIVCQDFTTILDLLGEHMLLIIDVDHGTILKSFEDEDTILPKKVQKAVIGALNLAKNMTDPTEMMRDVMISEACIHMFVEMLGHVANHLVSHCDVLTFQKEVFQKHAPSRSIQSFLQWFSETQMFEAFTEECIWRVNYRKICQSQQLTLFEKRVEEYKWEIAHDSDKISKKIGKTVKNIGEKLKSLAKS